MNTSEAFQITVRDMTVDVVRKPIKNLHLGVYPPDGRVRVAAPLAVSDDAVRLAVIGRLTWIHRQQEKFAAQPRQSEREMVGGETHYFRGQRYRMVVRERPGAGKIVLRNRTILEMQVPAGSSPAYRTAVLDAWYRAQLKELIPPLLEKWQARLDVPPVTWGVKRMKTKWGTCNIEARRICLNLELVKKPLPCLEYVIAHELTHLLERHHNDRFTGYLDKYLPQWRTLRAELNEYPLRDETWQ